MPDWFIIHVYCCLEKNICCAQWLIAVPHTRWALSGRIKVDHILLYHGKCYHNAIWSIVDFLNKFKKESWGSSYSCLRNAFARDVCRCCPSRSTAARYSESAARWTHSCSWGDDGSAFFLVNSKTCWLPLRNTTSLSAYSTCTVGLASILTRYSLYVGYYSRNSNSIWPVQSLMFGKM